MVLQAQYAELVKETKLNDHANYFYGFQFLDEEQFFVNQGYIGTFLLDADLNVLIDQPTSCAAKGGGAGMFSADGRYFMGVTRSCMSEADTVVFHDLKSTEKSKVSFPGLVDYIPYTMSNKLLCERFGEFWEYDISTNNSRPIKLTVANEGYPKANPFCMFINDDQHILVETDEKGLMLFDTKKWKLRKLIESPGIRIENLLLLPDGQRYAYSLDNKVIIRNTKDHSIYAEVLLEKGLIEMSFSSDGAYMLYLDKEHNIYFCDMSSTESTLLLRTEPQLMFWGLKIAPSGTYFLTGVNGNRVLKYKLSNTGNAPEGLSGVEVFSYSEAEAIALGTDVLKRELALRKLGYDIPLDNSVSRDDHKVFAQFCADHKLKSIYSDEAKAILELE